MRILSAVLIAISLSACANFDSERFQQGLQAAYLINQAQYANYQALNSQAVAAPLAPTPIADFDWAWDQFYHQGQLVWVCRGAQSGQFAQVERCAYKPQNDYRWPGK